MYSDSSGRLEHKGSFGFVQNAEKIMQVACFFSPRHPMRKIKPSYSIFNIYTDMPARTRTWSSSHFFHGTLPLI